MDQKNSTEVNSTGDDSLFASVLGVPGYFAANGFALSFVCGTGGALNAVIIVALLFNRHLKKLATLRLILFNIAVAGLVTTAALAMFNISRMLALVHHLEEAAYMCRVYQAFLHTSIGMRTLLLLTLSVVVYIVIRYGDKRIKVNLLCVALVITWVTQIVMAFPYFTEVYGIKGEPSYFVDGILCRVNTSHTLAKVHIGLSVGAVDVPVRAVIIIMVIATVMFIKKNTIAEQASIKKAMLRFASLLLVTNFITLFANSLPAFLYTAPHLATKNVYVILNILTYVFLSFPVVATPLLMMIIFKPVAKAVKEVVTFKCLGKRYKLTLEQRETSGGHGMRNTESNDTSTSTHAFTASTV